jgi:hypothetical protein
MAIEKRLTPEAIAKLSYQKIGVVVFIVNDEGEVLLLQENTSKMSTGKQSGEYGVLCETSDDGESWMETMLRGFREELGINDQKASELLKIDSDNTFLGEGLFLERVLARVCVVGWNGSKEGALRLSGDGEVKVNGWEKIDNLASFKLRRGVRNILDQCLEQNLLNLERFNFLLPLSIANLGLVEKI